MKASRLETSLSNVRASVRPGLMRSWRTEKHVRVRRAELKDLDYLVGFTSEEAREAEGTVKIPETLEKGIRSALEGSTIAIVRVLPDEKDTPMESLQATEYSNMPRRIQR